LARSICYVGTSAGDWGGASRSFFLLMRKLDRARVQPFVLVPSGGFMLKELDRMGIRYEVWRESRELRNPIQYLAAVRRAVRLFKEHHIELLHMNYAEYWRPAEILAARWLRIPVITHYRIIKKDPPPFIRLSDLVIANSHFTAKASQTRGVPSVVVHNIADLDRYDGAVDLRAELGIDPGRVVVTFVGQIRETKGIDLFLGLTRAITDPDVTFLIAGGCHDPETLKGAYTEERLRAEIGSDPRIQYLGHRKDVENVYRTSDIIVMPSRWDEPFGLVNIEAGASRKPVVSTRVGGIPEIITHGENGFLVDRDDLAGLVACTRKLIDDPALRQRIGETGRAVVEERFSRAPLRRLEAIYDALIERRPLPPEVGVSADVPSHV
jgi:glycosyltransferase involved in cell wall biosynthesis